MLNVNLYRKRHGFQKRDAEEIMISHMPLVEWKSNDVILDVGTGDGDVLVNVLLKNLPEDFESIVAADISPKMIEHAKKLCDDKRVSFEAMDIAAQPKPEHMKKYDHIFSFNTLHWVQDQKTAFKNIYQMLKDDGDCVIYFLAKSAIYDAWKAMSVDPEWEQYMKDIDDYISPYNNVSNPVETLKNVLYSVGFENINVELKNKTFLFDNFESLLESVKAVTPFINRIPEELHSKFLKTKLMFAKKLEDQKGERINVNNSDETAARAIYGSLCVYASKKTKERVN